MRPLFRDRVQAGQRLAEALGQYRNDASVMVVALPRGGVPVAHAIAASLNVPLELLIVRKLGVPGYPEVAMGAIASGGVRVLNQGIIDELGLSDTAIARVEKLESEELLRREQRYREGRPLPNYAERTVIVVDDGIATGATMRVAIIALREHSVKKLIVAVPVAAKETARELGPLADEFICLAMPEPLFAIGTWYQDFTQVDDDEVIRLLTFTPKKISQ